MERPLAFGIDVGSDKHHLTILTLEGRFEKELVVPHNYKGFKFALEEIRASEKK